jgi:hypothetical protein
MDHAINAVHETAFKLVVAARTDAASSHQAHRPIPKIHAPRKEAICVSVGENEAML